MSFLIVGLPRSRTAWFSAYFSACGHPCIHEGIKYCHSPEEYKPFMKDFEGDASSAGMLLESDADNVVIIKRNKDVVFDSLLSLNVEFNEPLLEKSLVILEQKMDLMTGLVINFADINSRLEEIHNHCVSTPFNPIIAEQFINMKIELIEIFLRQPEFIGELLWQ